MKRLKENPVAFEFLKEQLLGMAEDISTDNMFISLLLHDLYLRAELDRVTQAIELVSKNTELNREILGVLFTLIFDEALLSNLRRMDDYNGNVSQKFYEDNDLKVLFTDYKEFDEMQIREYFRNKADMGIREFCMLLDRARYFSYFKTYRALEILKAYLKYASIRYSSGDRRDPQLVKDIINICSTIIQILPKLRKFDEQ